MRAGPLRHRVTIQQKTGSSSLDGRGQPTTTWNDISTAIPVAIKQLSGNEGILARQLYPTATHKIHMRHRSDLTNRMRLTFGERVFNIINIERVSEIQDAMVVLVGEEI